MTISTDIASASYTGNGVTQIFPVPFYFLVDKDLKVSQKSAATGDIEVLTLNSDFTVSGEGDQAGGSITVLTAPPSGDELFIERNVSAVQETAYPENGIFPAASHEKALDRLTMLAQQILSKLTFGLFRDPLASTYDVGGNTLSNVADAVNPQDVPSLVQVQGLITGGAAPALAGTNGASLVGYDNGGTLATVKQMLDARPWVSVKEPRFGAVGDGVTDDTAAIQSCIGYCQQHGTAMHIPAGTYLVDSLNYGRPVGFSQVIPIIGDGANDIDTSTTLKKKTADGLGILTVGTTGGFTSALLIEGIKFLGISGDTAYGLQTTACDRATIRNCVFMQANYGFQDLGGVSNSYRNCIVKSNVVGAYFRAAPAPSTSVASNNNTLDGCVIVGNSDTGVNFGDGNLLNITNCDIEGNGTSGLSGRSGLFVSTGVGMGVRVTGTWFENNGVTGAVYLKSGFNTFDHCYLVSNGTATYDVYVEGGNYRLHNVYFGTAKTNNLMETAGAASGNVISGCVIPAKTIDTSKTAEFTGTTLAMRGGKVPVIPNDTKPLIQRGSGAPTSGGVLAVTFPIPFSATPTVIPSVRGTSTASVVGTQVSNLSATGFTITLTFANGSSVSTTNATFDWLAIGPG